MHPGGSIVKKFACAALTAAMATLATPAVSHVPKDCMPRLAAMAGAVLARNEHQETAGTVIRFKTAEDYQAASKAGILDNLTYLAEWTARLMELDDRARAAADAFSRCVAGRE